VHCIYFGYDCQDVKNGPIYGDRQTTEEDEFEHPEDIFSSESMFEN
jgi:hypothetical protein